MRSLKLNMLIILSLIVFLNTGHSVSDAWGQALKVSGTVSSPPYLFMNNEKPDGFFVDFINEIADVTTLEIDVDLRVWSDVLASIKRGDIDIVLDIYYSEERDNFVDFTTPILTVYYSMFTREKTLITRWEDLADKEIIVMRNDIMHETVVNEGIGKRIVVVETSIEGLLLLSSGKHDCFLGGRIPGLMNIRKFKLDNIRTAGNPVFPQESQFAVQEGNTELINILNEGILMLKQSGRFDEIHEKWFGDIIQNGHSNIPIMKYSFKILLPLIAVIAIMGLWSWSLRSKVNQRTEALRFELSERKKAQILQQSLHKVREAVWNMKTSEDVMAVAFAIRDGLENLNVPFQDFGINIINTLTEQPVVESYEITKGGERQYSNDPLGKDALVAFYLKGQMSYRKNLYLDDSYRELGHIEKIFGHKIMSVVDVPFSHGTLAVNSSKPEAFSNGDIAILEEMAQVLSEGFKRTEDLRRLEKYYEELEIEITERKLTDEELRSRLRYEEGLAACSQTLLADTEESLREVLQHLLNATGVSRVYVFENFSDGDLRMCQIAETCAPGIEPQIDNPLLQHLSYKEVSPELAEHLSHGQHYFKNETAYTPQERDVLEAQGIISILILPIQVKGEWYGFVGFDECVKKREWMPEDIQLLSTAAKMIGSYIARKQAEKDLRQSEEKLRNIFENSTNLFYSHTPDHHLIYISPQVEEMLGRTQEEAMIKWTEFITDNPINKEGFSKTVEAIESGKPQPPYELELLHTSGRKVLVEVRESPIVENGKTVAIVGVLTDITDRKRLEEQLQIRERMDSIGTLAGGMAHDFNNLLAGIMGNLELLRMVKDNLNSDQYEYLDESYQLCQKSARLINNFQSLSRGSVSEIISVDIHEVAQQVFKMLSRTTDRLIEKKIDIAPGIFHVWGQHDQLHQVFLNLGTNAIQAIEEKGVQPGDYIRISASDIISDEETNREFPKDSCIHIVFEDSGPGMTEEVKRRAFEPLFSTKERGTQKGQGLGLAMVYNIITRNHNGYIEIETEEGTGTKFHILLPKAEANMPSASPELPGISGGSETILIVEDEITVSKIMKRALTKYGYSVLVTSDGTSGLNLYRKKHDTIDLVILDLTLPKMSGKKVLEEIITINPDVKVVISSGHSEKEIESFTQAKGYIAKPYNLADLAKVVRDVLDE